MLDISGSGVGVFLVPSVSSSSVSFFTKGKTNGFCAPGRGLSYLILIYKSILDLIQDFILKKPKQAVNEIVRLISHKLYDKKIYACEIVNR